MDLRTITIADWLLISVTFLGPVVAVQVQKFVERRTEDKRRKQQIFYSLMATRAVRASNEHVQSLNLIELVFRGKSGKPVRDTWAEYFDLLEKGAATQNEPDVKMWNDKGNELLINLLSAMAKELNYDFNRAQLKRGVYYPKVHYDEQNALMSIRNALVKVLKGEQPIPMSVTSFPFSEDATKAQQELNSALLKVLSGETALKVVDPERAGQK